MIDLDKIKKEKDIEQLLEFSIINCNKPKGPTSFQIDQVIKKSLKLKKTCHFGTLDPNAEGVLPISLNRACRLCDYFMHKDKVYVGKFRIHKEISGEKLKDEMKKFVGKIMQKPPVKSAVKRQLRQRTVNKFEIIKKHEKIIEFISDVEAGTYIRKLISDLGENIGGAHMTELRRIKAGIFDIKDSKKIEDIEEAFREYEKGNEKKLRKILIPAEIISEIMPFVLIKESNIRQILTGKPLMKKDLINEIPDSEIFCVFLKDRFIEIARKVDEGDIVARAEFVLN